MRFHVKDEVEVQKEKSRVEEMLRMEKKLEDSRFRTASQNKTKKW